MNIGVNALYLIPGGVGGTEIYLRNLLAALAGIDTANRYFVFTNKETGNDLVPAQENFVHCPQAVNATSRPARIIWEQTLLPIACLRNRIDVLFNPGFTAPIFASCPRVTVFHDLQHKRHPEHFRGFDLPFWRFLLWAAIRRSRNVVAVSQATADDLKLFYRVPDKRITIVPHGVEAEFFAIAKTRATDSFLLCVSTLHPHKNLARLVRAFAAFERKEPGFKLIIAGMRGHFAEELEGIIAAANLKESVTLTGWVPREDLYDLYRRAHAFVYPSTFEGFGMPVLEAMAAGVPVACSDIPPLREIAGKAAIFFNPGEEAGLEFALSEISIDRALRSRLAKAGPLQAAQFTWAESAKRTLAALQLH